MAAQYELRNRTRWPLEKRFEVENGYELVSHSDAFCLSRVGFSADQQLALVFIRCSWLVAYYLLLRREQQTWGCVTFDGVWVT